MRFRFIIVLILLLGVLFVGFKLSTEDEKAEVEDSAKPKNPSQIDIIANMYDEYLQAELDSSNTVGAALAIIKHDTIVLLKPYGLKKQGGIDSVNTETVFRLASVSKGFAGVLSAKLASEGLICLDDKVINYLPGLQLKDSVSAADLTLKHTLNHTSGLVPHAFDNLIEAGQSMEKVFPRLKEVNISAEPGSVYAYQNTVFSLIDTVVRVKFNKTYQELLREKIFEPLNMKTASADFESMQQNSNIAWPHVRVRGGYVPVKLNKGYYDYSPAAGVNASISDMAKWMKALLGNHREVLDSSVLNVITSPSVYTPLKRRYTVFWNGIKGRYYSLGWRIYNYHDKNIIYHGGYVRGYRAEIAFCPDENVGIVFLQNSPNSVASKSIPHFWDIYFEQIKKDTLGTSEPMVAGVLMGSQKNK